MKRRFTKMFAVFAIILGSIVSFGRPGTYNVVLTKSGYQPAILNIKKGDSVKFTTNLNAIFWPASDPHPTHSIYPEFDPQKEIKNGDSWSFKFEKVGRWSYHDHIDPRNRATITVIEVNPFSQIFEVFFNFYKLKLEKHDLNFLKRINTRCNKKDNNRGQFLYCWFDFYAGITKDFGVTQAMNLLGQVSTHGMLTDDDCHLMADEIGTDAYWQYISGTKFTFTKDFAICDYGFFHHFMSEHVSHGQDIVASGEICDSLTNIDKDLVTQCYFGLGNGLTYYYWDIFSTDPAHIAQESLKKCQDLSSQKDTCTRGVYSGLDHLLQGLHGSELKMDVNNPLDLCVWQKNWRYKIICYERVIPSFSFALGGDITKNVPKINYLVSQVSIPQARREMSRRVGIMLSENENKKTSPDFNIAISYCRQMSLSFQADCIWGVVYSVYQNFKYPESQLKSFDCEDLVALEYNEKTLCSDARKSAGIE